MSKYIYIYLEFKRKSIHCNVFHPIDSSVKFNLFTCQISVVSNFIFTSFCFHFGNFCNSGFSIRLIRTQVRTFDLLPHF